MIIAKAGRPIAVLKAYSPQHNSIKFGLLKGQLIIPDDFDHPVAEITKQFSNPNYPKAMTIRR